MSETSVGRWALIDRETGTAREFTSIDPAGRFDPSLRWVSAPVRARAGWKEVIESGVSRLIPAAVADIREQLMSEVSAKRRQVEEGGIVLPSGVTILTGRDDQNRVSTALTSMERFGMSEIDFKSGSGWVRLTTQELSGIGAMVATHVQSCFSVERAHHEAIMAEEDIDVLIGYDIATGWPGIEERQEG